MYDTNLDAHDHTTAPDEPAFIGQVIDCGAEFHHLPDGTLAMSWDGRTWRVATNHEGNRVIVVQRRTGECQTYPISAFQNCGNMTAFQLKVAYIPTDL